MDACLVLRPRDERGARGIPTTQACQPGPAIGHRAAAPLPEDSVDPEGALQPPETVALRATGHRQGPLRARTPSARRRAIAGVARLGLTALPPTRRPSNRPRTVLESSSNRPRIVLEPSSNRPRTVPPGSTARITPSRRHAPECLGSARSPRPSMLVKSVGIRGLLTRSRCWGATSAWGGGRSPD